MKFTLLLLVALSVFAEIEYEIEHSTSIIIPIEEPVILYHTITQKGMIWVADRVPEELLEFKEGVFGQITGTDPRKQTFTVSCVKCEPATLTKVHFWQINEKFAKLWEESQSEYIRQERGTPNARLMYFHIKRTDEAL